MHICVNTKLITLHVNTYLAGTLSCMCWSIRKWLYCMRWSTKNGSLYVLINTRNILACVDQVKVILVCVAQHGSVFLLACADRDKSYSCKCWSRQKWLLYMLIKTKVILASVDQDKSDSCKCWSRQKWFLQVLFRTKVILVGVDHDKSDSCRCWSRQK